MAFYAFLIAYARLFRRHNSFCCVRYKLFKRLRSRSSRPFVFDVELVGFRRKYRSETTQ